MYEVKRTPGGGVTLVEDGLVVVSAPDLDTLAKRVEKMEREAHGEAEMRERRHQEAVLLVKNTRDGLVGVDHAAP